MRISDWRSDVCSSDLLRVLSWHGNGPCRGVGSSRACPIRRGTGERCGPHELPWSHDLPFGIRDSAVRRGEAPGESGRASPHTRARSEEHTSELQSLMRISYAVFCLKKKQKNNININKQ